MSDIDQRVVQLKFDNAQFATGTKDSLKQLYDLNEALKLVGATKGLDEVSAAANRLSMEGAKQQVSGLMGQFSALQVAAITALSNIVSKAVDAGLQLAKSLSIEPIIAGFGEYETNLNSIQTILANTGLKGADGLNQVNSALGQLNAYSDQTIFNFGEMAKNIGTFTAAGVDLKTSTAAIKGIANLAAISGSNAQQASTAMYQLSQALAAGKVNLEDWNSVVNAGMGGEVFKNALIETARVHGVAVDKIIKDEGGFRNSLQKGWITSSILTETLSKFTGELTADQLKSMGYNDQQIAGILEMGKTATDAATKVKSMTQLLSTLREAVGSGWSQTWQIVFGNFDEAKDLFTGVNNVLGKMISDSAKARNELLQGWKDLGGRDALIKGISNGFEALLSFLRPIRDAFREIFPATTAKQLFAMTVAFRDFMANLKLGSDTANNLRRTFAGFFAILGIGWELLKAGIKFFFDLIGKFSQGSGGLLKFTGSVGDFLVALHKAIKDGEGFTKFFDLLGKIVAGPIKVIQGFISLIGKMFSNVDSSTATQSVSKLTNALKPLGDIGNFIDKVWTRIQQIMQNISTTLGPFAHQFIDWAKSVGAAIGNALKGMSFDDAIKGVQTGLFAGLLLLLKSFIGKLKGFKVDGGFLDGIKEAVEGLTGALKGMQNALNAVALLTIAAAIGVLTLSFIGLAKIDAAGLARASAAIAVMMVQLGTAFVAFGKISSGGKAVKVAVMAAGLILLATAIRILASSVEKLAGIPIDQLRKGLIAVALLLGTLVTATNRLDANNPGMIRTAAGLVILGAALKILVSSVKELGTMDWNSLAKGLVGVGTLLGALALFTKFAEADKGGITQGAGIILLAVGLRILADAVGDFTKFNWEQIARGLSGIAVGLGVMTAALNLLPEGSVFKAAGILIVASALELISNAIGHMSGFKWDEIGRGLTVLAGALGSIAIALKLLPPGTIFNAAGILIVAASLSLIQDALGQMAGMSWEDIGKGLTVLAGSLIVMAGALVVVQDAVGDSVALLLLAAALNLLVPVLQTMGEMPWSDLIEALVGLAGIFVVLGAAALVLAPLTPVIFALAAGIGLLGLAVLAAGLGVLAFATGLTVLAAAGIGATAAIIGIVSGLVGLIPFVIQQIGLGLIAFAEVIATSGPAITEALVTVLNSVLDAIIQSTPKIVQALIVLLQGFLDVLVQATPRLVDAGIKMILALLTGIANNIGKITSKAVDIITGFINGLASNMGRIVQAGINLIISFMNAVGDGVRNNGAAMADAGWNMASGIVEGIIKGLAQLVKKVIDAAINLAKKLWDGILDFFGIGSPSKKMIWAAKQMAIGMAIGLNDNTDLPVKAGEQMSKTVIDKMGESLSGLSSVLGSDLIDFQPTIAPVLDLSNIQKDAQNIVGLLTPPTLDVTATADKANQTDASIKRNDQLAQDLADATGNTYNTFNQTNNSPKALSPSEVYRQTKNIISRAKGVDDAQSS